MPLVASVADQRTAVGTLPPAVAPPAGAAVGAWAAGGTVSSMMVSVCAGDQWPCASRHRT
jgi:hypothetical protein